MSTNKACCPEKVTELINHSLSNVTEQDREWLNGLKEPQINALMPKQVQVNAEDIKDETIKERIASYAKQDKGVEKVLGLLPEEMADSVKKGLDAYAEKRAALKKTILDNAAEGTWEDAELDSMPMQTLGKIAKSVAKNDAPADYSGQGGAAPQNNSEEEAPLMPGFIDEKKED